MGVRRAIITGATGPLGIALARHLTQNGIQVTAVAHPGSTRIDAIPASENIRVVQQDLSSLMSLKKALAPGYDIFFHLGWRGTENRIARDNPIIHGQNILHSLDAVELANALGCMSFVGAGSQSECIRNKSPDHAGLKQPDGESYGIAKDAARKLSLKLCNRYGIRHCWGRILSIYGPGERETTALMYCIHTLLNREKPSLTKAEQQWDYLYSADCARAFHLMAEKGQHGATYLVASGQSKPLCDYFKLTRDCIDPALPLGIGEKAYPGGEKHHVYADIGELTRDTGFNPVYSFQDGIQETIAWVRQQRICI